MSGIEHVRFQCSEGHSLEIVGPSDADNHRRALREAEQQARQGCPHVYGHDRKGPKLCGRPMKRVAVSAPAEVGKGLEAEPAELLEEHDPQGAA
jgi:hypothetical protein